MLLTIKEEMLANMTDDMRDIFWHSNNVLRLHFLLGDHGLIISDWAGQLLL